MSESAWAALRRRKIVQWGLAYVAGAWALLQGLQFLVQTFGWPGRIVQLATVALGVGLAIVLVVAWFHGDRGEQRFGRIELASIAALVIIGAGLVWQYNRVLTTRALQEAAERNPAPAVRAPIRSIAVLPFVNLSGDPSQDYLGDGLADTLIQQLAEVRELKVIARSSSFQFRGRDVDLQAAARKLGVGAIVEGSVQQSGDRIRVSAQLVNIRDGSSFWNKVFDRQASDFFGMQDEIAGEVVSALKLILLSDAMGSHAVSPYRNLDAYAAYIKGKAGLERRTGESLKEAAAEFTRATELDPDYALAYAGLAQTLVYLGYSGVLNWDREVARPAGEAVEHALQLDPNLAEAHAARGLLLWGTGPGDAEGAAEAAYRKAIGLAPGYAPAYHYLSVLLQNQNRLSDAESLARRAVQLDPLSLDARYRLASNLRGLGRLDEMLHEALQAISIDPQYALGYVAASVYFEKNGRPADAVRWVRKAEAVDPDNLGPRMARYGVMTEFEKSDEVVKAALLAASRDDPEASWPEMLLARRYLRRRDWQEAARYAARALQKDPADGVAQYVAFECRLQQEGPQAALRLIERINPGLLADPPNDSSSGFHAPLEAARVLATAGRQEEARRLVALLLPGLRREQSGIPPEPRWLMVLAYAVIDRRVAVETLREHVDAGAFWGWSVLEEPNSSEALKGDPEFEQLIGRLRTRTREVRADLERKPELTDEDIRAAIAASRSGAMASTEALPDVSSAAQNE
jgi:TolB-like protein/Flp pilus assembly protein TadD